MIDILLVYWLHSLILTLFAFFTRIRLDMRLWFILKSLLQIWSGHRFRTEVPCDKNTANVRSFGLWFSSWWPYEQIYWFVAIVIILRSLLFKCKLKIVQINRLPPDLWNFFRVFFSSMTMLFTLFIAISMLLFNGRNNNFRFVFVGEF